MNEQTAELVKALGMTISDYDMQTITMEPCVWWPISLGNYYLGLECRFDPFNDIDQAAEIANLFCEENDVNWRLMHTTPEKRRIFQASVITHQAKHEQRVIGQAMHVDPATALCQALLRALPEARQRERTI